MAEEPNAGSDTPMPTTESDTQNASQESKVTEEQWQAMSEVLAKVYDHRTENGEHDPSKIFHRKPNKRIVPDYYDVIQEPVALSTIKAKLAGKEYNDFSQFVRDFALIPHNAQVYNRPDAGAYQDALTIKALLESELKKIADSGVVPAEAAVLPYLGEIPAQEEAAATARGEGEEEEDEEDEDESGEDSDDGRRKSRGRGKSSLKKDKDEDGKEGTVSKRRGRPPRVDTPEEARIKNILKGLRRLKRDDGVLKISHFERLPDKAVMPEYYAQIKTPIAMDVLKKKMKRKKYQSIDQLMKDIDLMFENAKKYNEEDSEIFNDAFELQEEAWKVAQEERAKPDTDFVMEDGRIPLPGGIEHNGELYKVGDWVHIQNANDLTKPIVAQIYRTWQDGSGHKFVNACWYYRPEQTVHRFDKHFFDHEVVKTGQYRDHSIEEVLDRCFVMFITRFSKGRPRGLPKDKEVYVCEARYNEEKFTLNKIKTWASCLPDETRERDYEMDLFPEPKRMKKLPSPIAYLLKEDAKETDDLPKPEWGADNAPPKIGAVHKRPRDPKDSPPPERTPTPPPKEPTPPPQAIAQQQTHIQAQQQTQSQQTDQSSPAKIDQQPLGYATNHANTPTTGQRNVAVRPTPTNYNSMQSQRTHQPPISPAPARSTPPTGYPNRTPQASYGNQNIANISIAPSQNTSRYQPQIPNAAAAYQKPQPIEVWHLGDQANSSIPPDIRAQFQQDEQGHVLFFTSPPLDIAPEEKKGNLGHSARYLVAKQERDERVRQKRKRDAEEKAAHDKEAHKKQLLEEHELDKQRQELQERAVSLLEAQLEQSTAKVYQDVYGEEAGQRLKHELTRFDQQSSQHAAKQHESDSMIF